MAVLVGVVLGSVLAWAALRAMAARRAQALLGRWVREEGAALVAASQRHSLAVVRGQVTEQVTPLLAHFPWDPGDARFLGKPVDYVVFAGYGAVRDGRAERLEEIVFVDVKTGRAALSKAERRVRACVESGLVTSVALDGRPVR